MIPKMDQTNDSYNKNADAIGNRENLKKQRQQRKQSNNNSNNVIVQGLKGVQLKRYEQVVSKILQFGVQPTFNQLPSLSLLSETCNNHYDKIISDDSKINNNNDNINWPYDQLPLAARVLGNLPGQISDPIKAIRKENQIRSMLRCILALLLPSIENMKNTTTTLNTTIDWNHNNNGKSCYYTIVDFGGGSGHLSIPLALLLLKLNSSNFYQVVCVDLNERGLDLLHVKAMSCQQQQQETDTLKSTTSAINTNDRRLRQCSRIFNLFTFHGSAEDYFRFISSNNPPPSSIFSSFLGLDLAVALHLCGEATDVVLRLALSKSASIVVAPCCVGKLQLDKKNPYIYQATGQNTPTIRYPQSQLFCQIINQDNDNDRNNNDNNNKCWNALAKAADYSHMDEIRTSRNATRRTAKALLEMDRKIFIEEITNQQYQTTLTRMEPWEATPKNDILVAWKKRKEDDTNNSHHDSLFANLSIDMECQADIQLSIDHLLGMDIKQDFAIIRSNESNSISGKDEGNKIIISPTVTSNNDLVNDYSSADWTNQEEEEIRKTLSDFLIKLRNNNNRFGSTFVFPTGMGGRKRKLIHYVAEQMHLAHWSVGSKNAEKTVAVAQLASIRS